MISYEKANSTGGSMVKYVILVGKETNPLLPQTPGHKVVVNILEAWCLLYHKSNNKLLEVIYE